MASFSPGIQAPGGQYITSLSYNQDAQLAAVNAGTTALASYTYDGFGQRLLKTFSAPAERFINTARTGCCWKRPTLRVLPRPTTST